MMFYDMHCHVDLIPSMLKFAKDTHINNVNILAVTTTPRAYEKELTMLKPYPNIRVALGLHPQLVSDRYEELALVEKSVSNAKYIGEVGLDFNRQFYGSKENQISVFDNIIKWCSEHSSKIISIHSVHSDKAVLDILDKYACTERNKCILHWFSGSLKQLQRAAEMGCFFSINSVMLKSPNGQKLIRSIPILDSHNFSTTKQTK